ncbi:hypothetical protein GCM10023222_29150 [Saccharopolyspora cebuensis]
MRHWRASGLWYQCLSDMHPILRAETVQEKHEFPHYHCNFCFTIGWGRTRSAAVPEE